MSSHGNFSRFVAAIAFAGVVVGGVADGQVPTAPVNGDKQAIVWFTPRNQPPISAPDFMDLFKSDAPWQHAASQVKIFKLYPQFLDSASNSQLQTVIVGLQQRNIALAIEFGLVDYTDRTLCDGNNPDCGRIESSGGQGLAGVLARIKSLGGDLRYIAMDEPLWFGHMIATTQQHGAAQASIAALAKNVAKQVATAHQYFPDVKVGDIEPVSAHPPSGYVDQIMGWMTAYKTATGSPLAFFDADVVWQADGTAPNQLEELSKLTRRNGARFGVIYNGNPADSTGVEWTNNAERHFVAMEANPSMIPDDAIIQSWVAQPLYALPETRPGTMTYLVNRYAAAETELKVTRTKTGFVGILTSHGMPVADAEIIAHAIDDGTLNIASTASLTQTIPPGSATALLALRINTECNCDGSADIALGTARYVDKDSNLSITRDIIPPSQRVVLNAQQNITRNSPTFPVTAGHAFSLSVPMRVAFGSEQSGYVAIIFFNATGKETARIKLPFQPGTRPFFKGLTNKNGTFAANVAVGTTPPSIAVFDFPGSANFRLSFVTINKDQSAIRDRQ
jgi:hypothetical protein